MSELTQDLKFEQAPGRLIRNAETFRKMEDYLADGYLEKIEKEYLARV